MAKVGENINDSLNIWQYAQTHHGKKKCKQNIQLDNILTYKINEVGRFWKHTNLVEVWENKLPYVAGWE